MVSGRAERIPLDRRSCGAAWLCAVIHHVEDRPACAAELRRVLPPGGPVLICQAFSGRLEELTMFRFFPKAAEIAEHWWPRLEEVVGDFASAGFDVVRSERVPQISAGSLAEYADRIRTRTDSSLTLLADEEFERGMALLDRAADEEREPRPIIEYFDLLVLR